MSEREMSLTTTASRPLRSSFARPRSTAPSPCSAAKPTSVWPGARVRRQRAPARPRWARARAPGRRGRSSRSCRRRARVGRKSATAAAISSTSASANSLARRGLELGGGLHVDRADAGRCAERDVGRDQRHLGAAPGRLVGEREPHAAGRAVADVAHRVDRLARAAGGDQHAQPVERARRVAGARERPPRSPRGCSAARPAGPRPTRPCEASRPLLGRHDRARRASAAARGSPAWPGARTCGCSSPARPPAAPVDASAALVSRLSASPWASLAIVLADAGATQRTSARRDQLEVGDRVVVGRGLTGERAARGVGLELVHQHRRAGDALEGGAPDEVQAGGRLDHPHGVARRRWRGAPAPPPCRRRSRR